MSKKRSKAVRGSYEDSGKYYRCWNCSFPFNRSKIITGKGSGVIHTDFINLEQNVVCSGDPNRVKLIASKQGGLGAVIVESVYTRDSQLPLEYYTPREANAVGGCPMCGTKNLP